MAEYDNISLEKILLEKSILSAAQLSDAKKEAQKLGMSLERALAKLGIVSEEDVIMLTAESMGVPHMDLTDYLISEDVINMVSEKTARKFHLIPLFRIGQTLTIAMINPHDIAAIDVIKMESKVGIIETVFSSQQDIMKAIDQYYGIKGSVADVVREIDKDKALNMPQELGVRGEIALAEEAPVVKLVNIIITQAVTDKASDIHIEPEEDICRVRYRIDGVLYEANTFPRHLHNAITSRIKVLAKLDIAEKRLPQDGKIQFKMENKDLDLRISTFPTIHGENVVIRILDKSAMLINLDELGMPIDVLTEFDKLIHRPNGIVLVTGPTGSGKTTTLYAALSKINTLDKNIITLEDPVEYQLKLIRQSQVNPKAGLMFATGLRSILRQDPNVIMVGEIRDAETADIAIQAALTGHLVFSTLHTNDACGAISRLIDMGMEPFLISSSVIGLLAQRLVRVICDNCKEEYKPSEEALKRLGAQDVTLFRGKGCKRCLSTGYSGRIGIYELLVVGEEIRELINKRIPSNQIQQKARSLGMRFMRNDGIEKVKSGITTLEEVFRVTEEL